MVYFFCLFFLFFFFSFPPLPISFTGNHWCITLIPLTSHGSGAPAPLCRQSTSVRAEQGEKWLHPSAATSKCWENSPLHRPELLVGLLFLHWNALSNQRESRGAVPSAERLCRMLSGGGGEVCCKMSLDSAFCYNFSFITKREKCKWTLLVCPDNLILNFHISYLHLLCNSCQFQHPFLYIWYFSHYNGKYKAMKIIITLYA